MHKPSDYLPVGSQLEHYRIEKVLGGGGFSIVYLATNLNDNQTVVIKEYFPAKLAFREPDGSIHPREAKKKKMFSLGRKLFFQEASVLASLSHPNIIGINGFFHGNGTVYTAMAYHRGIALQSYIKKHQGQLSEKVILEFFIPILKGLAVIHAAGMLHLDIKPGNIYLCSDRTPILLDFGAVHKVLASAEPRLFPVVSHGFSPIEQSNKNAVLGPWTDLYAIGATMRACIEGKPPVSAKDRLEKKRPMEKASLTFTSSYSKPFLDAIDWAMQLNPVERPQTVESFLNALCPAQAG